MMSQQQPNQQTSGPGSNAFNQGILYTAMPGEMSVADRAAWNASG